MAPKPQPKNDFDASALTKQVDDHARDMATINKRLDDLETKFGTNEKIADTLTETAEKAVKMRDMLADNFVKLLNTNDTVKKGITEIVTKIDRGYAALFVKRFGFMLYTAVVAIVSAVAGAIAKGLITHTGQ